MNAKLVLVVSGSVLLATASTAGAGARRPPAPVATAALALSDGTDAGTAAVRSAGTGLEIVVSARGLPPGVHGIHLHMAGLCEGPAFTSAGSHLNPHGKQHGLDNPAGAHMGDLPNLTAAADGTATLSVPLKGSRADLLQALFDADGTSVVIHASADNNRTDPSGNSGGRIACGVLKRAG